MARPKSEEKREAILEAAVRVFAERGLEAPTSAISKRAGIAEGTLFTYFATKDELVNALYREIKLDLADAMMAEFPRRKSIKVRLRHVWDCCVEWGLKNATRRRVLRRIEVWDGLTKESRKAGETPFVEIKALADEAEKMGILRDVPRRFVGASVEALAEMAMEMAEEDPKRTEVYRDAAFEMLWAGVFAR